MSRERPRLHPYLHAQRWPEKPAYVMAETGEIVTYRDLDRRSNQAAQLFRSWGLRAGDAIALLADNHPRFLELCWAAQRAGLYYTPMSWHLTAGEVDYIVRDAGAQAVFVSSRLGESAVRVADSLGGGVRLLSLGGELPGYRRYEELRDTQPTTSIADETAGSNMLYTSGTTGLPKGVRLPLSGAPIDETQASDWLYYQNGVDERAVLLAPGPLYHASPLHTSLVTQTFGGTCIVPDRFDPEEALRLIERHRVTFANFVPTHFVRLLKLPAEVRSRYDLSSLRLVLHGAAPCPIAVKEAIIEWFGAIVVEYYGGTEGVGSCLIGAKEWLEHKGSVGRALQGAIHIVDESTWQERPVGAEGAIYFESAREFSYHNAPEKTAEARSPQGWGTLGDIGRLDAEGYLYLTDRKSDLIISGGVNIYPREAENRLLIHPKVADVAVFGVPHPEFGEEVKAVVQPLQPSDAGPELERELIDFCRAALASQKCPRTIDFEAELPRSENGKLYKRLLRDRYWKNAESRLI